MGKSWWKSLPYVNYILNLDFELYTRQVQFYQKSNKV
jgi:hypothetical protein